jgi:hypothetical protein
VVNKKQWILCENLKMLEQDQKRIGSREVMSMAIRGGVANTEYFHKCANGRKNTIIILDRGYIPIEGEENLLKHATEYYYVLKLCCLACHNQ